MVKHTPFCSPYKETKQEKDGAMCLDHVIFIKQCWGFSFWRRQEDCTLLEIEDNVAKKPHTFVLLYTLKPFSWMDHGRHFVYLYNEVRSASWFAYYSRVANWRQLLLAKMVATFCVSCNAESGSLWGLPPLWGKVSISLLATARKLTLSLRKNAEDSAVGDRQSNSSPKCRPLSHNPPFLHHSAGFTNASFSTWWNVATDTKNERRKWWCFLLSVAELGVLQFQGKVKSAFSAVPQKFHLVSVNGRFLENGLPLKQHVYEVKHSTGRLSHRSPFIWYVATSSHGPWHKGATPRRSQIQYYCCKKSLHWFLIFIA